MRRGLLVSLVFIVAAAVGGLIATLAAGNSPQLGLDLRGGVAVVLQPTDEDVESEALDQAIEVIRNRVDAIGVAEPEITRQGDRIVVQLPGVDDSERALELVGQTAELRFRPVLLQLPNDPTGAAIAQAQLETLEGTADPEADPEAPLPEVDPADVVTPRAEDVPESNVILPGVDGQFLYLLGPAELTGTAVDSASATLNQQTLGSWLVNLDFTSEGGRAFDQLAAQYIGQQVAIVLDGVVYSAPTIQQASFGGSAVITGDFSEGEAEDLALVLRFGALPVELEPATVQTVSATLGQDSLDAGIIAGLVGLTLVAIFMIAYYRLAGVVAMLSLAVSGALLWSIISFLGESQGLTLTLAGATGIIVSIGVQVDSNIVYYERVKEELRRGRSLRISADTAFQQAFSTIVKADVASLIGAFVLWWLTVGPVRGFAFFLGLATVLDLVVSWFFMRPALVLLARRRGMTPGRALGVSRPSEPVPGVVS